MTTKGRGANTTRRSTIDFAAIARFLLDRAEQLLPMWFPAGKRDGHEFKLGSLSGEPGRSLSINMRTGIWKDFAGDDQGGDLLSLYAAARGLSMLQAAKQVAPHLVLDLDDRDVPAASPPAPVMPPDPPKKPRSTWVPIRPVPADAPPYREQWGHYARGIPVRHWEYRGAAGELLGLVCRFETSDGGKEILPLSWCEDDRGRCQWRYIAFAQQRPLYGLDRLAHFPVDRTVIVVEGEKCVDALHELLDGALPVVTWPGGGKAVTMADWTPLAGRQVVLWPDHDRQRFKKTGPILPPEKQPGIAAMERAAEILAGLSCDVRIVDLEPLGEVADGWDVADAIAEGWTRDRVREYLAQHLRLPGSLATRAAQADEAGALAAVHPDDPGPLDTARPDAAVDFALVKRRGELVQCTANTYALLMSAPAWQGVIAYDEFAQRTVKLRAPPYCGPEGVGEWESYDDSRTAMWLATQEGYTPSSPLVAETIEVMAREASFHPVQQYLKGLSWDGTPRIDSWLTDLLGASGNEYTRLVARFFVIGMVKRVMEPGCKFDYCLVLEGRQGMFKSSALRALGGAWFKDTDIDLSNKDSMTALQGAWLYEIAEMDSLTRAEASKQKSFLSRQVDEFRPVYGRREVRLPRQVCFAGTTNSWEWNKDPTGGRRFWPVEVTDVDLQAIVAQRDQLFAEALAHYRKGAACYPNREQQRDLFDPEQLARQQSEGYVDALHDWVYSRTADFSMAEAVKDGLLMDYSKLTRDVQTRVGNALKALGCVRVEKRNGMVRFWYRPPTRKAASSSLTHAQQSSGEGHAPLPI
jgi:putative DNA primase/helicase